MSRHHVITIGRQLGSGGADMGKALAEQFGFRYIDKEILVKAAEEMNLGEENLEYVDEKNTSVWMALAQTAVYDTPYIADEWYVPTSKQLFDTQARIMKEAVEEGPCVIIGRCASYLFRNYEKSANIFLHADMETRIRRMEKTLDKPLSEEKARKMMEKSDRERARYYNTFTGRKWMDLRGYDFVLNTSPFCDEKIREILIGYVKMKFPEL